jgi:hypothetical protein
MQKNTVLRGGGERTRKTRRHHLIFLTRQQPMSDALPWPWPWLRHFANRVFVLDCHLSVYRLEARRITFSRITRFDRPQLTCTLLYYFDRVPRQSWEKYHKLTVL